MAEKFEINIESVTQELAKIGFSNMAHYVRPNPDGSVTVDLASATPEQLAAVESIQYEEDVRVETDGATDDPEATAVVKTRKVKFKLHDKKGALQDLLKHLGGLYQSPNKDNGDPNHITVTGGLPDDDFSQEDQAPAPAPPKDDEL